MVHLYWTPRILYWINSIDTKFKKFRLDTWNKIRFQLKFNLGSNYIYIYIYMTALTNVVQTILYFSRIIKFNIVFNLLGQSLTTNLVVA